MHSVRIFRTKSKHHGIESTKTMNKSSKQAHEILLVQANNLFWMFFASCALLFGHHLDVNPAGRLLGCTSQARRDMYT